MKYANMTYERRIASGILAETIKQFKGCTIQSTIRNSAHSYSDEKVDAISDYEERVDAIRNSEELLDAVSDPKSNPSRNPKVATHTTNGKCSQKLSKNRFVPKIIQGVIRPIDQLVTEDVPGIRETLGSRQTVFPKEIVTDTAYSGASIFWTLREVSRTDRDGSKPQEVNTAVATVRLTLQNPNFIGTPDSPTQTGNQDIVSPRRSIIPQKARNTEPLDATINQFPDVHGHPTPILRKAIVPKAVPNESAYVYA